jgi:acetyl esterase
MTLDPRLTDVIASLRDARPDHPATVDIDARRTTYVEVSHHLWPHGDDVAGVRDLTLALDVPIRARLYTPATVTHTELLVFFHGGAFVQGSLQSHDALCRRLATQLARPLLAVAYRLAPEHPFPAAVDDAAGAARYAAAHVGEFGAGLDGVIVIGDSAGAALAAHAATALGRGGDAARAQVLLYPTVGPDLLTGSAHEYAGHALLDLEHLRYDYEQYLTETTNHADPRVSLLMNLELRGNAPAVVVVAECDPLRDEGVAYAGLLEHFAVPVRLLEAEGMVHGFLRLGGVAPFVLDVLDDVGHALDDLVAS